MDRFLVAPINSGLQTNLKAWQIADDAYEQLDNAYVFRGRVRKRFGSRHSGQGAMNPIQEQLLSRVRINLGNTNGAGHIDNTVGPIPGDNPSAQFFVGQQFSIGDVIFTVTTVGNNQMLRTDGSVAVATFNTANGAYSIDNAPSNTPVYFYVSQPIQGLTVYEAGPVNDQPAYAFDTQFAYVYAGGQWIRSGPGIGSQWHGNDTNFFWAYNWIGDNDNNIVLFVTNYQAVIGTPVATDDPIWTFDGTTWDTFYAYFQPNGGVPGTGPYVLTARIIVPFKNRLVLLNTIENYGTDNILFGNRCRYSFNGSPFARNAWYEPNQTDDGSNPGGGIPNNDGTNTYGAGAGFIDATTDEEIISVEFIKDRLIVYFERSTWELAYTGNEEQPFIWQKINTELGSEATFSTVPFDKIIMTIGTTGVHACNGANVERIDDKIPDKIFQIRSDNAGPQRISGIRDYITELVYWTFPTDNANPNSSTFCNKIFLYNYKNGSWAFNDDVFTMFGYFEQQVSLTWNQLTMTWAENTALWNQDTEETVARQIIAGNHQGYILFVDPDEKRNATAMNIVNMAFDAGTGVVTLTIINHTLEIDQFITIENAQGVTLSGDGIYKVEDILDQNTVTLQPINSFIGVYTGGGTVARVSQIQILSKEFNPYVDKGRNLYLSKVDFCVERTTSGEVTVDYYVSSADLSMLEQGQLTGSNIGTNVLETSPYSLYPLEALQTRLWHPVYFNGDGEFVQFYISLSDDQMMDPDIVFSDFTLEGFCLYLTPTAARMQ